MDYSTSTISNTISKGIVDEEMSMYRASQEDLTSRLVRGIQQEIISNEEIREGDEILETYQVLSEAIHGGMGSVWCVHHKSWDVNLAMKRPQPRFFAEGSTQRKEEFTAECENWINLGLHPNIVSCYYVRDIGGVPSIFSEWMEGGSLKDCIRQRSVYEGTEKEIQARILDIAIQTARGLKYAHESESHLIHQDVKPGNILLTKEWDAKVADFGLAKAQSRLQEGDRPLSTGYTLEYCPKEQAQGAAAEPWMDVYAWALTVLEMAAGERLWRKGAEVPENLNSILSSCRIHLPVSAQECLRECLLKKTGDFDRAEELLLAAYKEIVGEKYPRPAARKAEITVGSLNNRALSYLDLGMNDTARDLWEKALDKDGAHAFSIFNKGMQRWTTGKGTDIQLFRDIGRLADANLRDSLYERVSFARREQEKNTRPESGCQDNIRGIYNNLEATDVNACPSAEGTFLNAEEINGLQPRIHRMYYIGTDGESCRPGCVHRNLYAKLTEDSLSADGRTLVLYNTFAVTLMNAWSFEILGKKNFGEGPEWLRTVCAGPNADSCYLGRGDGLYEYYFYKDEEKCLFSCAAVKGIKLRKNGEFLLFWDTDGLFRLMKRESGEILSSFPMNDVPLAWCEISPDGKTMTAGIKNSLQMYDLGNGESKTVLVFQDESARVSCVYGDYALVHTLRYVSIWDLKTGVCLRSIRFRNSVKYAMITHAERGGEIRGYILTSFPVEFHTFAIEAEPPRKIWELSAIRKTGEQLRQDGVFYEAIDKAEEAFEKQDWQRSLLYLTQARSVAERQDDPACIRLYDGLYPHFSRGKLLRSIALQDFGDQIHLMSGEASLSADGSYLLAPGKEGMELFQTGSGEKVFSAGTYTAMLVRGGSRLARLIREPGGKSRESRMELYFLPLEEKSGREDVKLIGSCVVKHGNHPDIKEAGGRVYLVSDSLMGTSVNLCMDAETGEVIRDRKIPEAEKHDALFKAARKNGMGLNFTRYDRKDGGAVFYYKLWTKNGKNKQWEYCLDFYGADAKQIRKINLKEHSLSSIRPLPGGMLFAEKEKKGYLFNVEDFLEEQPVTGMELDLESFSKIAFSEDCRYFFLDKKVYRAEWELKGK